MLYKLVQNLHLIGWSYESILWFMISSPEEWTIANSISLQIGVDHGVNYLIQAAENIARQSLKAEEDDNVMIVLIL